MAAIKAVTARPILDSRGEWTVEATIFLANNVTGIAAAPHGESTGSLEAVSLSAAEAVRNINEVIGPALQGMAVDEQMAIDRRLLELDGTAQKSKLGGNALLAVSLAAARAAATANQKPLWRYLRELSSFSVPAGLAPRLVALMIEGGLHAPGASPFQEYLIIPRSRVINESVGLVERSYRELREELKQKFGPGASRVGDEGAFAPAITDPAEPFALLGQVVKNLGLEDQLDFGLDAAATNVNWPTDDLFKFYRQLRTQYPLRYLEDPFTETDFANFARFHAEWGEVTLIVGDDLTVTNVARLDEAKQAGSINAVIIKPNQIGTLTETLEASRRAREYGWQIIVSHRGRETNDDFVADLAYGLGADGLKLGAPARGERIAKYNRLLAIEAEAAL